MREVLPGVWTWAWFSKRHGYDFSGTFVEGEGGNLVIDPVEPSPELLADLRRRTVLRTIVTNRNHLRGSNRLRVFTGARTAIHPADAEHARSQGAVLDDEIAVGERIGPFEVVGVPGKSPGEIALHWRERRLLVVGDAVVGHPPGRLSFLPDAVVDDSAMLRKSVRALLDLDVEVLLVGDGVPILEQAGERLRELVGTDDRT